ncbi:MAG: asparagine synthetase B, partial [Actinomycetota bacterium]|nr:asparagine synthetase B [Actinomycetota bacterium]
MCGICGIVRADGAQADRGVLARMSAVLAHRGPDSAGLEIDGEAGLAARRLAIIDLEGGDQPISGEDGRVTVVQNGEVYNHAVLRGELEREGHRFATHSDTEALVHLYEQHGLGFAELLRGMFAVALWDRGPRRLVLARDRFGIKPLYYRQGPQGIAFASELKALLELPELSRAVDLDALEAYLAFNAIHGPATIYRDVRKLGPGELLVYE